MASKAPVKLQTTESTPGTGDVHASRGGRRKRRAVQLLTHTKKSPGNPVQKTRELLINKYSLNKGPLRTRHLQKTKHLQYVARQVNSWQLRCSGYGLGKVEKYCKSCSASNLKHHIPR